MLATGVRIFSLEAARLRLRKLARARKAEEALVGEADETFSVEIVSIGKPASLAATSTIVGDGGANGALAADNMLVLVVVGVEDYIDHEVFTLD